MGLGWDSVLKLLASVASIIEVLSIIFFSIGSSNESFGLSVILILSVLAVILVLVSWRASKRLEKELAG